MSGSSGAAITRSNASGSAGLSGDRERDVKKRLSFVAVYPHPSELALTLEYTQQPYVADPATGKNVPVGEKATKSKTIRLQSLSSPADIPPLAAEILDKCKFIPPSRAKDIHDQILVVLARSSSSFPASSTSTLAPKPPHSPDRDRHLYPASSTPAPSSTPSSPPRRPTTARPASASPTRATSANASRVPNPRADSPSTPPRTAPSPPTRPSPSSSASGSVSASPGYSYSPARSATSATSGWDDSGAGKRDGGFSFGRGTSIGTGLDDDNDDPTPPTMSLLPEYTELLYEDLPDKVKATRCLAKLARSRANLAVLSVNESLLSALSRVLRDDSRRSLDLATHIATFFYLLSLHPAYHHLITSHKVGDACLRIVQAEERRSEVWEDELRKVIRRVRENPGDQKRVREAEGEGRRYEVMRAKQERLLFACIHLLLNLSLHNATLDLKIVRRAILPLLLHCLRRSRPGDLQTLVVSYLARLACWRENVEEWERVVEEEGVGVVDTQDELGGGTVWGSVGEALERGGPPLVTQLLRLLSNIALHPPLRASLLKITGPSIVATLCKSFVTSPSPTISTPATRTLYLLTVEDRNRRHETMEAVVPLLTRLMVDYPSERVPPELAAAAVNLAHNARLAKLFGTPPGSFKTLLQRGIKTRDPLLLKLCRTLAVLPEHKTLMLDQIDDLAALVARCFDAADPDRGVEAVGVLAEVAVDGMDWARLTTKYSLLERIDAHLVDAIRRAEDPSSVTGFDVAGEAMPQGLSLNDDWLLEVIVLLGTMTQTDPTVAQMVVRRGIVKHLVEIMVAKEEDDEIILQVIYAMGGVWRWAGVESLEQSGAEFVAYLIDLLYDRNPEIRQLCDTCLDIITEMSPEWGPRIRYQRFRWHNAEWFLVALPNHDSSEFSTYSHQAGGRYVPEVEFHGKRSVARQLERSGGLSRLSDDNEDSGDNESDIYNFNDRRAMLDLEDIEP
ncbi:kinesin-associated [Gonapodya prolifera JEL478]|uniref:Kinesin-associated n=1 Tax=Gonapodya prolifera (strain JEL478) TaxID=1344416 RepID=A0A139ALV4_GONPJ|nr:kinesin-associated [Gonapodya prolifera JEL478]|eukprot:KXS17751.1 kinesin-associated [Gonapodya prolifera JEL478]